MLAVMIGIVAGWIVVAISAMGYGGLVGLMAIESACIPLPSEIVMPFTGYLVSTGQSDPPLRAVMQRLDIVVVAAFALALARFVWRQLRP